MSLATSSIDGPTRQAPTPTSSDQTTPDAALIGTKRRARMPLMPAIQDGAK
ncbi:MAG: hypothetical protein ACR2NB_09625 [Solirubrobacteraceae bacterium]